MYMIYPCIFLTVSIISDVLYVIYRGTGIYTYTLHMAGCEAQRGNRNFESKKFACFYIVPIAPPPSLAKVFYVLSA